MEINRALQSQQTQFVAPQCPIKRMPLECENAFLPPGDDPGLGGPEKLVSTEADQITPL